MSDEIETTEQLVAMAVLRDVAIRELGATRHASRNHVGTDLPADELRAPDSPDEDAAVEFFTRAEGTEFVVRCRVETGNAFGSFLADGEAIFDLPAPLSPRVPDIERGFIETVGAPVVFPYIRAAVASIAAQVRVAAPPLPLLHNCELALAPEGSSDIEEGPSAPFASGSITQVADDGRAVDVGEFFIDYDTGTVTRIGAEDNASVSEFFDAVGKLPPPGEITFEDLIRQDGEGGQTVHWLRTLAEGCRDEQGDAVADTLLTEIDGAVARVEEEGALRALNAAMESLACAIATAKCTPVDGLAALIDAAENAQNSWGRMRSAMR